MSNTLAALCASMVLSICPGTRTACGACQTTYSCPSCPTVAAAQPRAVAQPAKPAAPQPAAKPAPQQVAKPALQPSAAQPAPAANAPAAAEKSANVEKTAQAEEPATGQTAADTRRASVSPSASHPVDNPELHPIEEGVIERTNAVRARYGLRPLVADFRLMRQARRHTAWMARSRSMTHSGGAIENIAMGQRSPTEVVNTWLADPPHAAPILNAGYTKIGVAAYRTPEGTVFWCQQFRP